MQLTMLYAKLHNATVTKCELHYNGSMGIDADYLEETGVLAGQQIDVLNINNGERFTTYVIAEPKGSKTFGIYGAAARKAQVGDKIIIIAYAVMELEGAKNFTPKVKIF